MHSEVGEAGIRTSGAAPRAVAAEQAAGAEQDAACAVASPGTGRVAAARAQKRSLILRSATRVFAEKGYHDTRISDIASHAGIAYGLVYHYFSSKDEVLSAIFHEHWGRIIAALEAIKNGPGGVRERLFSFALLIFENYRVHPDWFRVLLFEIQRNPHFERPGELEDLFRHVVAILVAGQRSGELREDLNAKVAAMLFIGSLELTVIGMVVGAVDVGREGRPREAGCVGYARTTVEIFLNGFGKSGEHSV